MLLGTTIDNLVVGGPAYNSRQLSRGDVIIRVDGVPVSESNVHEAMVGSDVPGSSIIISVARGSAAVRGALPPPLLAERFWHLGRNPHGMAGPCRGRADDEDGY